MGACRDQVLTIADKIAGAGGEYRAFSHQVAPVLQAVEPGTTALRAVLLYAFATSSPDRIAFAKPGANGNVSIRFAMVFVRML